MRITALVTSVLLASTVAWAAPQGRNEQLVKAAEVHFEKGRQQLAGIHSRQSRAVRLQSLDRSIHFLRKARAETLRAEGDQAAALRRQTEASLVWALDDQAEIYLDRRSLSLARKRVEEAAKIAPEDVRTQELTFRIRDAAARDVFYEDAGATMAARVYERRAAAGIPLRERGWTSRR